MKTAGRRNLNRWVTAPCTPSPWRGRSELSFDQVGWEARKTPAAGEVFFLDFPLYRTYQDGKASAIDAGFAEKTASRAAENLLAKYRDFDFKAITQAMGVDRISIGLAIKRILQGGAPRDVLSAARLILANMGELTDSATTQKNVTVNQQRVMVIVGATEERKRALREGGRPYAIAKEELSAASGDVIDAEYTAAEDPASISAQQASGTDARRLVAGDFAGKNLGDTAKSKRRYY
jgi:hypothetical protein